MLSPIAQAILAELNQRLAREHAEMRADASIGADRAKLDKMLLPVGEQVGHFMLAAAIARGAKTILEMGSSFGYSTLFLASAAKATGGRLISLEIAPEKQAHARALMERAGLADVIDFHLGDAVEIIERLPGPFDLVLLDLWKELYIPCFERFHPKLAENAFVLADNMLIPPVHRTRARAYQALVRSTADLESCLLPIGEGVEFSVKIRGLA